MSDDSDIAHPRAATALFGHAEAEAALLESYRGGRIPHAWLIGGPSGIGKATLAYRMARFVLAHPDPRLPAVQKATSLAVDADNAAARRIANEAHPDLLGLERVEGDSGKLNRNIKVDQVRRTISFFGSTAGEGGWRVAIVDSVDELDGPGENALLKVLEEPPARSLLLLISHAPGRVLPTIRSRCRRLMLRPLTEDDVARAMAAVTGADAQDGDIKAAAAASDGSVAKALALLDGPALALRQRVLEMLAQLPNIDPRALHALGDALGGTEPTTLATFVDLVNGWLSARLDRGPQEASRMAQVAQVWERVNAAAGDVEEYNLERKPLVFSVFGALAEVARG
ncbi:MAG TPA: DNA polymerase III subunit delta' [Pseudolabrys sp.]|nr:DNA polymerase III subunit delta' [Pseudolabrys sp.]